MLQSKRLDRSVSFKSLNDACTWPVATGAISATGHNGCNQDHAQGICNRFHIYFLSANIEPEISHMRASMETGKITKEKYNFIGRAIFRFERAPI